LVVTLFIPVFQPPQEEASPVSKIVECVPNFSEGRRAEVVDAIAAAAVGVGGVTLLGREMDGDHNRSVLTFAGPHEAVLEAAFRCVREARDRIDLRNHTGAHPRMGAADVVPFVPLGDTTMEECAALARRLGERIASELGVPAYLYGDAALRPDRRNLADVRRGEFEGLRTEAPVDPARAPDFGGPNLHESAGATAVGARFFLIAYNVNLRSTDLKLAKRIAKAIREKDGGLPGVRAMGFDLPEKGFVQVSMNLVDFRKTSMETVYAAIAARALEAGVEVAESEIIGLVPRAAVHGVVASQLRLDAPIGPQIIEDNLGVPTGGPMKSDPLGAAWPFVEALASASPTPGGGSAAALAGSLGAALCAMVGRLTSGREKFAAVEADMVALIADGDRLTRALHDQIAADSASYDLFMTAMKMPKGTADEKAARKTAMAAAARTATEAPLATAILCMDVIRHARKAAEKGNPNAASDGAVAALLGRAALRGAILNVKINLPSVKDEAWVASTRERCDALEAEAATLEAAALAAAGL
jgi:glutamate formiminotransferase/formiminotetrahydrofolate cyclodeaminase